MKDRMVTFASQVSDDAPDFFRQCHQKRSKKSVHSVPINEDIADCDITILIATYPIPYLNLLTASDEDGDYFLRNCPQASIR